MYIKNWRYTISTLDSSLTTGHALLLNDHLNYKLQASTHKNVLANSQSAVHDDLN